VKSSKLLYAATAVSLLAGVLSSPAAGAAATRCWRYKRAELAFAAKVNVARRAAGVGRIYLDRQLSRVAREHTYWMGRSGRLFHTASWKLRRRVTNWSVLGENVGVGAGVDRLQYAFMHSPEHRSNILYAPFRHLGVGVRWARGRMWVSVEFESHSDPGTRLSMPPC
jgi:uncharacterized protein YkwD